MFSDGPSSGPGPAGSTDMRSLWMQDQSLYSQLGIGNAGEPSSSSSSTSQQAVGWGGQQLPASNGYRVPWFGRNRNKGQPHRQQRVARSSEAPGASHAPAAPQAPAPAPARSQDDVMSVEEMVQLVKRLQRGDPLPDRLFRALHHLDSRAAALLLKDLSKAGQDGCSIELFDALRALPERHLLRPLCDVYTYTAMISLCIYQQNVDRALELLSEMHARGIERNVHTYTALMNVCIKCGRLTSALEIFQSMKAEGCTPNVVTYNTLIDVHGKLGQWDRAVSVLRLMRAEGVTPALRTFNTLIIACNMCNQPREALAVYQELRDAGFEANSTTFNALISAYGKMGQLDRVLEVYKDMVWKGLERSVITYSSLISACEKAGRWETALQLFEEMQRDGCTPNTVTYNSLITACGQGAQWEKARQVFDQMQGNGCTPDVVTYTALISALERGGQWQLALDTFQEMVKRGCRPDAIVYNAIIDALWQTGVVWAQAKARELFAMAVKHGHFRNERSSPDGRRSELNLHVLTAGVAMLSLHSWLHDIRSKVVQQGEKALPPVLAIVTDAGNASKEQGNFIIKEAVNTMMSFWGSPFRPVQDTPYLGVLEAPGPQLAAWVCSNAFAAQMASLFPASTADPASCSEQLIGQREFTAQSQCGDAFGAVQRFESSHNLALQNMALQYLQQRTSLVSSLLEKGTALGLKDEMVHGAVLLLDRAASTAAQMPQELLPLVAAGTLQLSMSQGSGLADGPGPSTQAVADVCGAEPAQIADMVWRLRQLLNDDTLAISTMRCLKVYLERMGYRYLDKQGIYIMAGLPIMLAVEALFDMSLLNCRPSVVAAALLYAERRQRGAVPFWPSMLGKMTGYEDLTTPELACAVRTAQKLCRKVLYTQIYRAQATNMAAQAAAAQQQGPGGAVVDGSAAANMARAFSAGSTGSSSSGSASIVAAAAAAASHGSNSLGGLGSLGGLPAGAAGTSTPQLALAPALPAALGGAAAQLVLSAVPSASMPAITAPHGSLDYSLLGQQHSQQQQQLMSSLPMANSLPMDLSGLSAAAAAGNRGLQHSMERSVFAGAAAGFAPGAVEADGLHAAASVGQADQGLENLAFSLGLLGLNGPADGELSAAALDAALAR